jgi:hypothetical protein
MRHILESDSFLKELGTKRKGRTGGDWGRRKDLLRRFHLVEGNVLSYFTGEVIYSFLFTYS